MKRKVNIKAEEAFWKLLRAGLWNDNSFLEPFGKLDVAGWKEVYRLSLASGTYGLVADGIMLLDSELRPDEKILKKYTALKFRLVRSHALHNHVLADISLLLRDLGYNPVLLKGQGVSIEYVCGNSRSCGDIDIYLGEKEVDEVVEILKERGITCQEEIDDNEKHAVLFYKDIRIELHRHATFMSTRRRDAVFREWWLEGCGHTRDIYVCADGTLSNSHSAGAVAVSLPPSTQNVFFLFYHVFHHYLSWCVQFRQFCDLAVFLRNHRVDDIDEAALGLILERLGLMYPWQVVGAFLNRFLGVPIDDIPFFKTVSEKTLSRFVSRLGNKVLYAENEKPADSGRLRRKITTYTKDIGALMAVMPLFPKESLRNFALTTGLGIRNLFNRNNRDGIHDKYLERKELARDK